MPEQQPQQIGVTPEHMLTVLSARARTDKTVADLLESARWEATARLLASVLDAQRQAHGEQAPENGQEPKTIEELKADLEAMAEEAQ